MNNTTLRDFLIEHWPRAFHAPFDQDIDHIAKSLETNGLHALPMNRGSGKSTLCIGAAIWASMHLRLPSILHFSIDRISAMHRQKKIFEMCDEAENRLVLFGQICACSIFQPMPSVLPDLVIVDDPSTQTIERSPIRRAERDVILMRLIPSLFADRQPRVLLLGGQDLCAHLHQAGWDQ